MPTLMSTPLAVRFNRARLALALTMVTFVSWAWIVVMARDMYGPMTGASAWMMTPVWDGPHLLLLWAMWAVMMTAMMLPSAMPFLMLAGDSAPAMALGYVSVWAVFSVAATALQWLLGTMLVLTPMMEAASATVSAVLLLIAGIYQWTPAKQACLTTCQSPVAFLSRRWRNGTWGAFRMGVEHGAHCVGCCWALMLLLFAGGVMNLWVIAALTVFVGFEKLAAMGRVSTRVSGGLLVAAAVWLLTG